MTGCYPRRVDLDVNARPVGTIGRQVLFPKANKGLNPNEITVAEILKEQGYNTACIGKWHLGDQNEFLPTKQGFDYYYGIPYSNDMNRDFCPLPLMEMETVIEAPVDQNTLTKRYTEKVVEYIKANNPKETGKPFFVYFPHAMTHNPLHASESFRGKSANGIYGDAVEEIDWSTGEILKVLKELGIRENTMVMFSSDNGAAKPFGGTNAPLYGWKASTFDGGQRVPFLVWWPGKIKAGIQNSAMINAMDVMPTIAKIAGSSAPHDRIIDGKDISTQIFEENTTSPHEFFAYYQKEQLQAIRSGNWKLQLPLDSMYANIHRVGFKEGQPLKLIDLSNDITEQNDVSSENPEIVKKLMGFANQIRNDIGDLNVPPTNQRKAGMVENPIPQLMK
jgi:arylsulfatase A-like enzyme